MKECRVIHIHDGDAQELTNGNWHTASEYEWAGNMLSLYLNAGYEIQHVIPEVCPAQQRPGCYSFYKDGFTVILVREAGSGPDVTPEDWEELNTLSDRKAAEIEARRAEEEREEFCFAEDDLSFDPESDSDGES